MLTDGHTNLRFYLSYLRKPRVGNVPAIPSLRRSDTAAALFGEGVHWEARSRDL